MQKRSIEALTPDQVPRPYAGRVHQKIKEQTAKGELKGVFRYTRPGA